MWQRQHCRLIKFGGGGSRRWEVFTLAIVITGHFGALLVHKIEVFYWTTLGLAMALLLVNGIIFPIAFKTRPRWMQRLDKERSIAKAQTHVMNIKPTMSDKTVL